MKLLLINANTTQAITDRLVAIAQGLAPPGVTVTAATGRFGARYIASRAAAAIAEHATIDAFAEQGGDADAVLIACYGDPALDALRELATVPVLGLADATAQAACRIVGRFGVVSGGAAWKPMLEEFHRCRGYADRLSGVRSIIPTGGDIARDPDSAVASLAQTCLDCVTLDGAEAVVLGGAGLAGLAAKLAALVPVPVLCSVETGIRAAFAALGGAPIGVGTVHAPVETIGLSAALAKRLG
jgi:Asp/Glu/hydantoin racemase